MVKKTQRVPGELVRTNQMFITLKSIGEIDENGKTVFSVGYSGKNIAEPDRPLSTALFDLVIHIAQKVRYSSKEAEDADLREFKRCVKSMKWVKNAN
jgi:hypothetical protein